MVVSTNKDSEDIRDHSTGADGYLKYTTLKEKGKINQLDVGGGAEKTSTIVVVTKPIRRK